MIEQMSTSENQKQEHLFSSCRTLIHFGRSHAVIRVLFRATSKFTCSAPNYCFFFICVQCTHHHGLVCVCLFVCLFVRCNITYISINFLSLLHALHYLLCSTV